MGRAGGAEGKKNCKRHRKNCDPLSPALKQVAPHRAPYSVSTTDLSNKTAYIRFRLLRALPRSQ